MLYRKTIILSGSMIAFMIMLVTFTAYMPALSNGFVSLDDGGYVINNTHIKSWTWENVRWMFTTFEMNNWHPLTWLSYTLDYSLFNLNPWGYHLVSVVIHGFNTIWLFLFALVFIPLCQGQRLFETPITYSRFFAAAITALLLGIHPQHVESVAWVSERKDVLFLFFTLPTLLTYLFYVTTGQMRWYWIAFLCFILACLSKPMVVSVPFILILLDIYPLKRTSWLPSPDHPAVSSQKRLMEKLPFLILASLLAIVTFFAQQNQGAVVEADMTTIDGRLINAANSLILYLSRLIFPVFLSPYYPISQEIAIIPVIVFFLISSLVVYFWYHGKPAGLMLWFYYLITLLPVLGIIQVGSQAMADRYAYLPLLPFYLIIGISIAKIDAYWSQGQWIRRMGMIMVVMFFAVILFNLTQQQTLVWKNDFTLWSQSLRYNSEENARAHTEIARIYMNQGHYQKAVDHFQKSLKINPELKIYALLANAYFKLGQLQESLKIYEKMNQSGLETAAGEVDVIFFNMTLLYFQQREFTKAKEFAEKTLKLNPKHPQAKVLLERIESLNQTDQ